MKAMLFKEITEGPQVEKYLDDEAFVAEQKMDGARVLARRLDGRIVFYQRNGVPMKFAAATQHLPGLEAEVDRLLSDGMVLDGELMIADGQLRVFDLFYAERPGQMTYVLRRGLLKNLLDLHPYERLVPVEMAIGRAAKVALLERVRAGGGEGVMFKNLYGGYAPGERASHSVKLKFVKSADVVVLDFVRGRNEAGREVGSATLGVLATDVAEFEKDVFLPQVGRPFRPVGACSLIGKPEVRVGDVVEVNYLYWTGSALYQPRLVSVRADKEPVECTREQFQTYTRAVL